MATDTNRTVAAMVRRVVFSGLAVLGVWILLFALRTPAAQLARENADVQPGSAGFNQWTTSFWTNQPVSQLIGQRIGTTVQLVLYAALLGLAIAGVLLTIGVLIAHLTDKPPWLARIRTVLRLIFVSGGVSSPVLLGIFAATIVVLPLFGLLSWGGPVAGKQAPFSAIFYLSLLPAFLLVQAGVGELGTKLASGASMVAHLAVTSVIRLIRLTGAVLAVAALTEMNYAIPGLGRLFVDSVFRRDFPVVFGIVFLMAVIVVVAKMVADLVDITYRQFAQPRAATVPETPSASRSKMPTVWMIISLALMGAVLLIAIILPNAVEQGYNQINLTARLSPPSAAHTLGTDNLGRDVFSRLVYGARLDVFFGLSVAAVVMVSAVAWSLLAGLARSMNSWLGDTLEDIIMLPRDILAAVPWLVLLLVFMSLTGPSTIHVAVMAGIVLLPHLADMIREGYMSAAPVKEWLHGIVLAIPSVFIMAIAGAIIYVAAASFLGLGVPPPVPELGSTLSGAGRQYLIQAPWIGQSSVIALSVLLFAIVMAAGAVQEKLGVRSGGVWAKVIE